MQTAGYPSRLTTRPSSISLTRTATAAVAQRRPVRHASDSGLPTVRRPTVDFFRGKTLFVHLAWVHARLSTSRRTRLAEQAARAEQQNTYWETHRQVGDCLDEHANTRHRLNDLRWQLRRWARQAAAVQNVAGNRAPQCNTIQHLGGKGTGGLAQG